jgi:hypothetical protein
MSVFQRLSALFPFYAVTSAAPIPYSHQDSESDFGRFSGKR